MEGMKHSPGFLKIVDDAKSRIREMSVEDVARAQAAGEDLVLIDVREESEWNAAHAEGAIHLGKGIIERDIEEQVPEHGKKLALYCGGGYRSALAADALQKMGYTEAYSVAGGWRAWNSAGLPIVEGE